MNLDLYDRDFFKWHHTHVHLMSVISGERFAKQNKFKSIVDYGCGIGSYLLGCFNVGVTVKGYEIGPAAQEFTHPFLKPFIEYIDFLTITPERYDVAMCIEVAEHIDPEDSEKLIDILVKSSEFIVFSAAPPGQEGTGHINCQSTEYWIELFEQKGFKQYKENHILEGWEDAPDYVIKNLMTFKK